MMKKHNFNPGPSALPDYTIDETAKALYDFAGTGMSLASISHRSKEFLAVLEETKTTFKEVLNIPDDYATIFLGGGASLQFAMIPYNFMAKKAVYVDSGSWASKAAKEAKLWGEVVSIKAVDYMELPVNYNVPADADYIHITTNNTIFGTELHTDPQFDIPLIADASSDILSRPMDVSKYAMIYGGVQKNLGPAGLAFVIIKKEMLTKIVADRKIPTMLNYQIHVDNDSLYNTIPVIPIYASLMTLRWLKNLGGLDAMYKINNEKAALLYNEIDTNPLFAGTVRKPEDRSIMNICFVMSEKYKELEKEFLDFATARGIAGIKGHRSVGGFRASTYNAVSLESVTVLVDAMKDFAKMKA